MMQSTEAEAKTRWCPFTRLYVYQVPVAVTAEEPVTEIAPAATGGPANRFMGATGTETNPDSCRCLGSQCMAWVWIGVPPIDLTQRIGVCGLASNRL